jgi:hypothetical protein
VIAVSAVELNGLKVEESSRTAIKSSRETIELDRGTVKSLANILVMISLMEIAYTSASFATSLNANNDIALREISLAAEMRKKFLLRNTARASS